MSTHLHGETIEAMPLGERGSRRGSGAGSGSRYGSTLRLGRRGAACVRRGGVV